MNPAKLEDFLGSIVQVYGPKMLRYKGVLHMKGTERKVIFQGVHQLMGSDLGPKWAPGEKKSQQDGLHRHRSASRHPAARPGAMRVLSSFSRGRGRLGAVLPTRHGGYNPRARTPRGAAFQSLPQHRQSLFSLESKQGDRK